MTTETYCAGALLVLRTPEDTLFRGVDGLLGDAAPRLFAIIDDVELAQLRLEPISYKAALALAPDLVGPVFKSIVEKRAAEATARAARVRRELKRGKR